MAYVPKSDASFDSFHLSDDDRLVANHILELRKALSPPKFGQSNDPSRRNLSAETKELYAQVKDPSPDGGQAQIRAIAGTGGGLAVLRAQKAGDTALASVLETVPVEHRADAEEVLRQIRIAKEQVQKRSQAASRG